MLIFRCFDNKRSFPKFLLVVKGVKNKNEFS